MRHSKYDRLLAVLLPGNVLFQLASIATGWTFSIDQNNHYYQGRYYYVYFIICIIVMFAIVSAYHQFEQKTFSGDRLFMFYTFFVVFLGIVIQEVSGEALRTTLLTIAIRTCFLLNRFNNFTQKISRDNVVMRTDIMTGIVKARRLTVCACLGYLKLVFRGNYYVYANCKNKLNTYHNIWQILTIYAGKCGQVRCQSTLLESCSLRSS
ncbi:hypothetical protein, partial [Lactobacillus delbrueckii]|uniref:hypothetical protein n=1 Tax=Lactobacillus delbrueckii TaxID=1584 RepID=UPI001E5AF0C7